MITAILVATVALATPTKAHPHKLFAPDAANQKFAAVNAARATKTIKTHKPVTKLGGAK